VPPLSPNHTVTTILDLFTGVRGYFASLLDGVVDNDRVFMAFKDERGDVNSPSYFPAVTIYINDLSVSPGRRCHGVARIEDIDEDATEATVSRLPTPVDIRIQVDAYSEKVADDWDILQKMLPVCDPVCPRSFTTPDGVVVNLAGEAVDNLNDLQSDALHRKSFQFRMEVNFPGEVIEALEEEDKKYLVLQRRLDMGGLVWTMDDPPE